MLLLSSVYDASEYSFAVIIADLDYSSQGVQRQWYNRVGETCFEDVVGQDETRLFFVADPQQDFVSPAPLMPPACSSSTSASLPPAVHMEQQASSRSRPSAEASQEVCILEPGMTSLEAATVTVVMAASEQETVAEHQFRVQ